MISSSKAIDINNIDINNSDDSLGYSSFAHGNSLNAMIAQNNPRTSASQNKNKTLKNKQKSKNLYFYKILIH